MSRESSFCKPTGSGIEQKIIYSYPDKKVRILKAWKASKWIPMMIQWWLQGGTELDKLTKSN